MGAYDQFANKHKRKTRPQGAHTDNAVFAADKGRQIRCTVNYVLVHHCLECFKIMPFPINWTKIIKKFFFVILSEDQLRKNTERSHIGRGPLLFFCRLIWLQLSTETVCLYELTGERRRRTI
jgi:hypothetical protein